MRPRLYSAGIASLAGAPLLFLRFVDTPSEIRARAVFQDGGEGWRAASKKVIEEDEILEFVDFERRIFQLLTIDRDLAAQPAVELAQHGRTENEE